MTTLVSSLREVLHDTWPMIVLACTVIIVLRIIYLLKNKQQFSFHNEIMMLTFIVYILCMFQIVTSQDVSGIHGVNITLFKELTRYSFGSKLFYRNIIGNIIMFLPFGFFTSYYLKLDKKRVIILITVFISVVIEGIQLKIGRAFDVDDILLNMVGGLFGYFLYRLVDKVFGNLSETVKGTLVIVGFLTLCVMLVILYI